MKEVPKRKPVVPTKLLVPAWPWARAIDRTVLRMTGVSLLSRQAARVRKDPKLDALLLTTIGRKSGLLRSKALSFTWYQDAVVLLGSNSGRSSDPEWVQNLRADSRCWVRIMRHDYPARARITEGEERSNVLKGTEAARPQVVVYDSAIAEKGRPLPIVLIEFPFGSSPTRFR